MITVKILKNSNDKYIGIECYGHAGYAKYGKPDICCAAVSALVVNCFNSVEKFSKSFVDSFDGKDGLTKLVLNDCPDDNSQLLIDSLILGLEGIQLQYGKKHLKVSIEEV